MKLSRLRRFLYLSSIITILLIGVTFFIIYINQINFLGHFHIESNQNIISVKTISPLNKVKYVDLVDGNFDGYYKSITIEAFSPQIKITSKYFGKISNIEITQIEFNHYRLVYQNLSIYDKILVIGFYNRYYLLKFFIIIVFLLLIFKYRLKMFSFFSSVLKSITISSLESIKKNLYESFLYVTNNKVKMFLAIFIDLIICLILKYALKIDFATLYGCSPWLIYPIVYLGILVLIIGLLLERHIREKLLFFFAFWLIFLIQYFIISPNNFAGNFGFYGAFQDFILNAINYNFISNMFTPDTGYLAIFPRMVYGLAININPSISQVIAITSIISLTMYSYIMASLLKNDFSFLWVNPNLAFVFVIMISIFPIFSLVPNITFNLPITDVSYYGILFVVISLISIKKTNIFNLVLLSLFNCILILSKAHFVVLLPLFLLSIFVCWKKKYIKEFWYSLTCAIAIMIQAIYSFNNLNRIVYDIDPIVSSSFSLNLMSISEQLLYATIYFIKSYASILFPFINSNSPFFIAVLGFVCFFILYLIFKSFRIIFYEDEKRIAYWFMACNITALSSSFFYSHTLSSEHVIMYDNLIHFVEGVKLNLMTYTIGVHTLLAVSIIPYIAILTQRYFRKIDFKYKRIAASMLFLLFFINGVVFNKVSFMFPEFWAITQNDRWSNEWKNLAPLIKQKEYYVPIIFYPENKQNFCSDGIEIAYDIIPMGESTFKIPKTVIIHSLIVLNKFETSFDNFPFYVELYHNHLKKKVWKPIYQPNNNCRFIIFTDIDTCESDSLVFKNRNFDNVNLYTHIRIVSAK